MIRSFLFCSALVASSGAGAVALSVMHDTAFNVEVGAFAEPENSDAFVIPAFAPVRSISDERPAVFNSASTPVLTQPSQRAQERIFLTPVSTGPNEAVSSIQEPTGDVQVIRAQPLPTAVKPQARVVSEKKHMMAPKIVPQVTRSFSEPVVRTTAVAPKYIIGVYR